MVVIRLSRRGAKQDARYRVTVADNRRAPTGKYLEIVGTYLPHATGKQEKITLDMERVNHWIKNGAQPTRTVASLIRKVSQ